MKLHDSAGAHFACRGGAVTECSLLGELASEAVGIVAAVLRVVWLVTERYR